MRTVRLALLAAAIAGLAAWGWWSLRPPTVVLYRGGPILTMDGESRVVEALVTRGDRIVAAGSAAELALWEDRGARVVELDGRAVVPGFVDAHSHFPGAGIFALVEDLNGPPVGEVRTLDDLVARLAARASATSAGEWVLGAGYDDTLLLEKRHPTRADLDRVSTDHPVAVLHVSGHLAAVNGIALARLGVGRDTPDPPGGRIRRDATGEPDGVLEETASDAVLHRMQHPSLLDSLRMIRRANELYLAAGVTTAQDGLSTIDRMRTLARASRLGLVPMRLVLWPGQEAADALLDGGARFASDERWVRRAAVKLFADGSLQGYTAFLRQPYFVPPEGQKGYLGYPRHHPDELREMVARYHVAGLQVAVHGNGDAAIDFILDAIDEAQQAVPRDDPRHVVVHAQMAGSDQLDRMKDLGVIPSFFVLHTYYWGDRHRDVFLGRERAARISPTGGAAIRGLRFTLHADTPVVPMEPLRIVWAAVNRRTTAGEVLGPEQRIDPMLALRAVTIDAAFQHFEEADKGSLEVGKFADLVILDRSPLDDPARIDQIRVLETIVAGVPVWTAAGTR